MIEKKLAIDRDAIRAMVRQVLRDALPEAVRERVTAEVAAKAAPAAAGETGKVEEVSIASDADLQSFVRRIASLAADPKQREALQSGRIRFRLKRAHKAPQSEAAAPGGGGERVDKGIVNERRVLAAAKAGKRLVVGKGVVVTPLARDKARQLGVQIERD